MLKPAYDEKLNGKGYTAFIEGQVYHVACGNRALPDATRVKNFGSGWTAQERSPDAVGYLRTAFAKTRNAAVLALHIRCTQTKGD